MDCYKPVAGLAILLVRISGRGLVRRSVRRIIGRELGILVRELLLVLLRHDAVTSTVISMSIAHRLYV